MKCGVVWYASTGNSERAPHEVLPQACQRDRPEDPIESETWT